MLTGKLIVIANKTLQVQFTNSKGKLGSFNIKESELSEDLLQVKKTAIAQLNGLEVELEEVGGQPKQIRQKGKSFVSTQPITPTPKKEATSPPQPVRSSHSSPRNNIPPGDFHNPYNFVPALPRNIEGELGDRSPCGHGSYLDNHWSGRISVTLTTITPLLIPDAAKAEGTDHKTYPLRLDADGKPYLPPTSIKGMLRSAYEAVTNSRLSIFVKHEDRLAFRMSTNVGIKMIPACIEKDENDNKVIRFFPGTSSIKDDGSPSPNLMYAAWLPRYRNGQISRNAIRYPNGNLPEHRQEVEAWVEKFQHSRWDKKSEQYIKDFQYWRVRKIVPIGETLGDEPDPNPTTNTMDRQSHQSLGEIIKIRGFVCITNPNIDRKHDERVFFNSENQIIQVLSTDIEQKLEKQWLNLINNYQEIHEDEICKRHKDSPPALNNSIWSRHIKGTGYSLATQERNLEPGTLCYARVRKDNNRYEILGLYPVIIARELFTIDPLSLLPQELRPAIQMDQLSPADRVFGWVNQNGQGSYKGNLRINLVECNSDDAVESFGDDGFPLAILGQPKPQQARFYIAQDKQGTLLDKETAKEKTYQNNNGLRGRKVYPHHNNLPAQYWNNPVEDRTQIKQGGHFQEYRRPHEAEYQEISQGNRREKKIRTNPDGTFILNLAKEQRDDQNRSITAWVKPNTTFSFHIDITNLSDVELGGLLWLLSLPENHYHRLGGGKPLGFGSAMLTINWDKTDLRKGEAWREFYSSLYSNSNSSPREAEASIAIFKNAVTEAYGNGKSFEEVRFIQAFCCGCQGFNDNKPVHYPRTAKNPNPEGKAFEWFVANERIGRNAKPSVSLPELWDEDGLPYLDPR